MRNETIKGGNSLDPQGVLYKNVQDHGKELMVLIVPMTLQKYVLYESHSSLGHSGTTLLYNISKEAILLLRTQGVSAKGYKTLFAMSNNKFTDTKLCTTSSEGTSDSDRFHFNGSGQPT